MFLFDCWLADLFISSPTLGVDRSVGHVLFRLLAGGLADGLADGWELEERIIMEQPQGFIRKRDENKMCMLKKSQYGLNKRQ